MESSEWLQENENTILGHCQSCVVRRSHLTVRVMNVKITSARLQLCPSSKFTRKWSKVQVQRESGEKCKSTSFVWEAVAHILEKMNIMTDTDISRAHNRWKWEKKGDGSYFG